MLNFELGFISFEELALRIYPTLTQQNISTIIKWIKSYSISLQRDQKAMLLKEEKDEEKDKRKILPKSTLKRVIEVFELFDEEKKGCKSKLKKEKETRRKGENKKRRGKGKERGRRGGVKVLGRNQKSKRRGRGRGEKGNGGEG